MSNLAQSLNGIALAYLGDGVYEVFVREHLLELGVSKPNQLQRQAVQFVSAKAQAALIEQMQTEQILTSAELAVYHRGRNAKSYTKAKNTEVITYRMSTGFEAVFGYLKLTKQEARIAELAQWCLTEVEKKREETTKK
ncbi:Mini-ribonuclease 3 [Lapidilactobacillus gannanensis]|jgi:ribonuclease-3 family protein|uniref:Mini-ribonuclease 3 n=1 Tax=Lapidilactobacillus gannanensis TaxID=2486002 RepID=A0ABW4BPF7_9LACO|nr:ribonuclease III domain-containing protein [Lapidilactobacillus gannanensis]MCH4056548.1 Mini-ribonuclease 3 [Lactobacillaceae bacterium]